MNIIPVSIALDYTGYKGTSINYVVSGGGGQKSPIFRQHSLLTAPNLILIKSPLHLKIRFLKLSLTNEIGLLARINPV